MPLFVLFFKLAVDFARVFLRKTRKNKPQPLCVECCFVHLQYDIEGRRAISCTFGGGVRPMKLEVLRCTGYRARDLPFRKGAIGFVREVAAAE